MRTEKGVRVCIRFRNCVQLIPINDPPISDVKWPSERAKEKENVQASNIITNNICITSIWNWFTNCTERCVSIVMQSTPCKFQLRKSRHEVKHNYIVFWLHSVYKQYLCDRIHLIGQLHRWYRAFSEICNKISNWSSIEIGSIIDTYTFPILFYVFTSTIYEQHKHKSRLSETWIVQLFA